MLVKLPIGLVIEVTALIVLALTNPEAVMLLAVRLVKKPIGLVTDVTALIVLALTNPEADMLLAVRLVKLPMGLVIEVAALIVLALTNPLALKFDNPHVSTDPSHRNEEEAFVLPESYTSIPAYLW